MEWLTWLTAHLRLISSTSVKTGRYEIRTATVGGALRLLRELDKDGNGGRVRRLDGRRRGTRSAHHSERPDRRP